MSTVLVTGGAGFIGSNLAEALLRMGHQVRILDNLSTGKRENLVFDEVYPFLEMIEGDICELITCQRAMEGIEYVFHQAALPSVQRSVEDPLTSHTVNTGGTLNLLIAAKMQGRGGSSMRPRPQPMGILQPCPRRRRWFPILFRHMRCRSLSESSIAGSFFNCTGWRRYR